MTINLLLIQRITDFFCTRQTSYEGLPQSEDRLRIAPRAGQRSSIQHVVQDLGPK